MSTTLMATTAKATASNSKITAIPIPITHGGSAVYAMKMYSYLFFMYINFYGKFLPNMDFWDVIRVK